MTCANTAYHQAVRKFSGSQDGLREAITGLAENTQSKYCPRMISVIFFSPLLPGTAPGEVCDFLDFLHPRPSRRLFGFDLVEHPDQLLLDLGGRLSPERVEVGMGLYPAAVIAAKPEQPPGQ